MIRSLLLVLLVGCSENNLADTEAAVDRASETGNDSAAEDTGTFVRLDVLPAPAESGSDPLPQSFHGIDATAGDVFLDLRKTVTIMGNVSGTTVTPWRSASLPGSEGAVSATVDLVMNDTVQSYRVATDENGDFDIGAVGGSRYQFVITPDDPVIPFLVDELFIDDTAEDQLAELGTGVAVFGAVRSDGEPLQQCSVRAVHDSGVSSTGAPVDLDGRYQIRVQPGRYDIVVEGCSFNKAPTLRTGLVDVGASGLEVDFDHPLLDLNTAVGRVEDSRGNPIDDVTVRFTAEKLTDYTSDDDYSLVVEDVTNGDGTYEVRLMPGSYTIDFVPRQEDNDRDDFSGATVEGFIADGGVVETIALQPTQLRSVRVVGPQEHGLEGARIHCVETSHGSRYWSAVADSQGDVEIRLPNTGVTCEVAPPGDRRDLALRHFEVVGDGDELYFDLGYGEPLSGVVELDGQPQAFALVEAWSTHGVYLGRAVTGEAGRFNLNVLVEPTVTYTY